MWKWTIPAIFIAFVGATISLMDLRRFKHSPLQEQLVLSLKNDLPAHLNNPRTKHILQSVRTIEVITSDDQGEFWTAEIKKQIQSTPTGKFHLETLILPWNENNKAGASVLFRAINVENQNLELEWGRTFHFN